MRQAIYEFSLAFLTLCVICLVLFVSHLDNQLNSSLFYMAQVRYDNTRLLEESAAAKRQLGHLLEAELQLQKDMAGLMYRHDLLINASRTGWWSSETLALMGREFLYRKEYAR